MSEEFASPALLSILCVLMGAAVFFAPHVWLLERLRNSAVQSVSLGRAVMGAAMAALFTAALFSQIYALIDGHGVLWPEVFVLAALAIGSFILGRLRGMGLSRLFVKVPLAWFVINLKVFVFMLATAVIIGLFTAVNIPVRESVFVTGAVWIAALYKLHVSVQRQNSGKEKEAFHRLLWPLVLGLLFWMLPLLLNELIHSEGFPEMLHRSPPLQRA